MKNILKVFLSDVKRLSVNVVAIIVIFGLAIIPALYAWFNIMSNWDPYGESATSAMHVAVYSEDQGTEIGSLSLNMGKNVIDSLEANDTVGWIFAETRQEALEGVYSGDYYAALILPESFTTDMISFVTGDIENPAIEYYENSKKNAIATKITSKVKTTVQNQINSTFLSTLAEVVSEAGEMLSEEDGLGAAIYGNALRDLDEMNEDISTYISILDTFSLLTESANSLVDSAGMLIPGVESLADSSLAAMSGLHGTVLAGAEMADTIAVMVDLNLDTVTAGLNNLQMQVEELTIRTDYADVISGYAPALEATEKVFALLDGIDMSILEDNQSYVKAKQDFDVLRQDMEKLKNDASFAQQNLNELKTRIIDEIAACRNSLESVKAVFDEKMVPELKNSVGKVDGSIAEAEEILSGLDGNFSGVSDALQTYSGILAQGTDSISASREYVAELQSGLNSIIFALRSLTGSEDYQEVMGLLQNNPEMIAEFIASPVQLETEAIYPIETYGSAMAPFYTVLALWVGALILVALIHVKVKRQPELDGVKPWQSFFGRYMTFFLIGQIQAIITTVGSLMYIGIQCLHPLLFIVTGMLTSFAFTLFMYALTVAFENVGEAVAVVFMVVQVAGSGGTFPVEVLPKVYREVYPFLPFTYCMNAMRECVGGLYGFDYLKDIGALGIYVGISLLIGLVLGKPFQKLIGMIDESKKRSGIML